MTPSKHHPRDAAVKIVTTLQIAGHTAYFAGGCVRDTLLGQHPKDYDVATDAKPNQVCELFNNTRLVGEAFGVALVRLMRHDIEVATFRLEWGYEDGRRPGGVEFTDAEHDAQRRDFTVNGLFQDPLTDEIIDFVGGQADIQAKVIRAIGDPDQRFAEDYLRMLRAPRFAARLDFDIETKTARAIRNHARYLGQISRERIGLEVQAMLSLPTDGRSRAISLIQELNLDGPTLNEDHSDASCPLIRALVNEADYATSLAAWLMDRHGGRAERMLPRWRKALSLSNDVRDATAKTLRLSAIACNWSQMNVAKRKRLLAEDRWHQTSLLVAAMHHIGQAGDAYQQIEQDSPKLFAEGVAPEPFVSGEHLIDMGLTPSPLFGQLLNDVYDEQLIGTVTSQQEALRWVQSRIESDASTDNQYNSSPDA